jgi:hypothetical protein
LYVSHGFQNVSANIYLLSALLQLHYCPTPPLAAPDLAT